MGVMVGGEGAWGFGDGDWWGEGGRGGLVEGREGGKEGFVGEGKLSGGFGIWGGFGGRGEREEGRRDRGRGGDGFFGGVEFGWWGERGGGRD